MKLTSLAIVAALVIIGWTLHGSPPTAQAHEHDPADFHRVYSASVNYSPLRGDGSDYRHLIAFADAQGATIKVVPIPFGEWGWDFMGHNPGEDAYKSVDIIFDMLANRGGFLIDDRPQGHLMSTCLIAVGNTRYDPNDPKTPTCDPPPQGAIPTETNSDVGYKYVQFVFAPNWDFCATGDTDPDCVAIGGSPGHVWALGNGNPSGIGEVYIYQWNETTEEMDWFGHIAIPRCDPVFTSKCHANYDQRWFTVMAQTLYRGPWLQGSSGHNINPFTDTLSHPLRAVGDPREWLIPGARTSFGAMTMDEFRHMDGNMDGGVGGPDFLLFLGCSDGTCNDGSTLTHGATQ